MIPISGSSKTGCGDAIVNGSSSVHTQLKNIHKGITIINP